MMAHAGSGADERQRRLAMLKLRNEWLSHGYAEDELPSHLHLQELRIMPHADVCFESEYVWALTPAVGECLGCTGR